MASIVKSVCVGGGGRGGRSLLESSLAETVLQLPQQALHKSALSFSLSVFLFWHAHCGYACVSFSVCLSVQEPDEADALLKAERSHILTLKKTLEAQLRKVQTQLQVRPSHTYAIPTFAVTGRNADA